MGSSTAPRIRSLDCLRGLIMALMALDHARGYLLPGSFDPLDLKETTTILFLTRWVTHICAPLFVFLAGTSAFLFLTRGKTKAQLTRYLITRGLVLIAFELFYISKMLTLSMDTILLQVLWALGVSMMILSALIWLPEWAILAYGAILVFGHNLLDGVTTDTASSLHFLWSVLHQADQAIRIAPTLYCRVLYPLIPWTGVMALGYVFGKILLVEEERRIRILYRLGIALSLAFVVIRFLNVYGDPYPWFVRRNFLRTFLIFINCNKYPPSLSFLLMTMGPGLLIMGFLEKRIPRAAVPLITFGSVPMFFYLIHFPLLLSMMYFAGIVTGSMAMANLAKVYLAWVACLVILYPACRWYAALKKNRDWGWMKYI